MSRAGLVALWCAASAALAHEGEHDAPIEVVDEAVVAVGSTGEVYEVLAKFHPVAPGQRTELKVFVSDAHTNEPVSDVQLELAFTGQGHLKVTPQPTKSPGVFVTSVLFPAEGDFDVVATVTHGEEVDLLALGTAHVEMHGPQGHPESSRSAVPALLAAAGLAVALLFAVWMWRTRRRSEVTDASR